MSKIYIAGKITGDADYRKKFNIIEQGLIKHGNKVMNPAVLPDGFEHHEYMEICYKMIDACEKVLFLPCWVNSKGAKMEHEYAKDTGKIICYL